MMPHMSKERRRPKAGARRSAAVAHTRPRAMATSVRPAAGATAEGSAERQVKSGESRVDAAVKAQQISPKLTTM